MKSPKRMLAVLLAIALMLLAAAPFALAADGAAVTVQHGSAKRFEIFRKMNDQWNTVDTSFAYKDFSSVTTGDESIAKIVDQNGTLMIVGNSIGNTTYTATTKDGATFTGYVTVINPAPASGGGGGGSGTSVGVGVVNLQSGTLFLAVGQNTFTVPVPQGAAEGGTWVSGDTNILTINASSGQVNALRAGQTMLTYTAEGAENTVPVYISSDEYQYKVEYYNGLPGGNYPYPNYAGTQGYSENYGRVIIGLKAGVKTNDITFSAQGDISVDPQTGYFYRQGPGTNPYNGYGYSNGYGYGYNYGVNSPYGYSSPYAEWRGTIIMTSPTMGTKYVNVRLT